MTLVRFDGIDIGLVLCGEGLRYEFPDRFRFDVHMHKRRLMSFTETPSASISVSFYTYLAVWNDHCPMG